MTVTFSTFETFGRMQAICLENKMLRLTVLPEYGANIWSIYWKPGDRELLWHHPRMTPRRVLPHEAYDDVFFGGSHLLYPNDVDETVDGMALPDHGELWSVPWSWRLVETGPSRKSVELAARGPVTGTEVRQLLTLAEGDACFDLSVTLVNTRDAPLDYMLKLHTAVRIAEGDTIELPCASSFVETIDMEGRVPEGTTYRWPVWDTDNGEWCDMSRIPSAAARKAELQYGLDLAEGRCALRKNGDGLTFSMTFDPAFFPTVWTFASYGGWRDLETLIFEPSTGYPMRLDVARTSGICRKLGPREEVSTRVRFAVSASE